MAWDHPVAGPGLSCSGHDRWKQENHGWMDLTPHGAFQQGFLHAATTPNAATLPDSENGSPTKVWRRSP